MSDSLALPKLNLRRALWLPLVSIGFRYACFVVMIWLTLWAEARPAPSLPDLLLSHVPYVAWVDRLNYVVWLLAYVPVALLLWRADAERFCRYMVVAGGLALIRGITICMTGLGPVRGADVNAGLSLDQRIDAFLSIASIGAVFRDGAAHVYLTKDLFFSGHTATTFLLLLYVWRYPTLRTLALVGHVLVVVTLFLSHLHYTIDVIGAYAITFSLFALCEGDLRRMLLGAARVG